MTAATRRPIRSITKGFAAMLVRQLVDEGRLDLDDPVMRQLPERCLSPLSAPLAAAMTIRHLLANTSGLPYMSFEATGEGDDALKHAPYLCQGVDLVHRPGERFAYNNTGFILAG